jgi:chromosome segregation ATPase
MVLCLNGLVGAATIKDVPADHWAYQSVKELVDRGLLSLYEDGTFRGADKVSRYQLAEIVARILEDIESGKTSVGAQDMDLLRKLSVEFQQELVDLAIQGDVFKEQIKALEQKNIIQDEFMAELKDTDIASLNNDLADLSERVTNIESDVSQLIDNILTIKELHEEFAKYKEETSTDLTNLRAKLDELTAELKRLEEMEIQVNNEVIQGLQDRVAVNSTRLNTLQEEVNNLKAELVNKEKEIEELETENKNYKTYVYGLAGASLLLLLLSSN